MERRDLPKNQKNEAFLRYEVAPIIINGDCTNEIERIINLDNTGYDNNLAKHLANNMLPVDIDKFIKLNNKVKKS